MNKLILALGACSMVAFLSGAANAEEKVLTEQQNKMSVCSKEAAAKDLHGDKRKEFMKECLSSKSKSGKKLTEQQQKMVTCSKEAKEKALSGDKRKAFMSECLKK